MEVTERSSRHRLIGVILLAGLTVLKVIAACRYRFNTDETQHLHVVWGCAHGLIQYRDIFDNHPPLFAMAMGPLFRLFPERADIVVWMRLLMIPFYVAGIWAVYRIARVIFPDRAAIWLALIGGAMPTIGIVPGYFFPGTEFRPDDPYAAIWLWALAVAVEGEFTWKRAAVIGFLLGICTGITMKTALLVSSLTGAAGIAFLYRFWLARWRPQVGRLFSRVTLLIAASLIVPGLLILYFAAHHAIPQLIYCVLKNNVVPHGERWGKSPVQYFYLPVTLPFLLGAGYWIYKTSPDEGTATRRVLIALIPPIYSILLYGYWPEITDHDLMPVLPLAPISVLSLVPALPGIPAVGAFVLPALFVLCLVFIWRQQVLQRGSVAKYVNPIATVLKLTTPDEYVMDVKGDAIYRKRPIYYAIETFARLRMKLGWIPDNLEERIIETRTTVCFHPPYPLARSMKFVDANYLPLASTPNVFVLGQKLPARSARSADIIHFTVPIPSDYVLLNGNKPAPGLIDGKAWSGSVSLAAGEHDFVPADPSAPVTLFWARAWDQGYRVGVAKEAER